MIFFKANSGLIAGIVISLIVLLLIIVSVLYFLNKRNPNIIKNLKSRYSTFVNEETNKNPICTKNPLFNEMEMVNLFIYIFGVNVLIVFYI